MPGDEYRPALREAVFATEARADRPSTTPAPMPSATSVARGRREEPATRRQPDTGLHRCPCTADEAGCSGARFSAPSPGNPAAHDGQHRARLRRRCGRHHRTRRRDLRGHGPARQVSRHDPRRTGGRDRRHNRAPGRRGRRPGQQTLRPGSPVRHPGRHPYRGAGVAGPRSRHPAARLGRRPARRSAGHGRRRRPPPLPAWASATHVPGRPATRLPRPYRTSSTASPPAESSTPGSGDDEPAAPRADPGRSDRWCGHGSAFHFRRDGAGVRGAGGRSSPRAPGRPGSLVQGYGLSLWQVRRPNS